MRSRIPPEAFEYYASLGANRSYEEVAKKFDVSKTAVVNYANRENWQARLARLERDVQQRGEERAVETIEAMNERHLRTMQVIQKKALEALKSMPIETAIDAVRSLDIAVRQERLIRGEPSERTEISTESILRREFDAWMREVPDEPEPESGAAAALSNDATNQATSDSDEEVQS